MAEKKAEEKRVTVQLFKDNDKYKDPVWCAVNGKGYQIQRGVPVEVPENIAALLQDSMDQEGHAMDYINARKDEYRKGVSSGAI